MDWTCTTWSMLYHMIPLVLNDHHEFATFGPITPNYISLPQEHSSALTTNIDWDKDKK